MIERTEACERLGARRRAPGPAAILSEEGPPPEITSEADIVALQVSARSPWRC
jgi:hypothetical protein